MEGQRIKFPCFTELYEQVNSVCMAPIINGFVMHHFKMIKNRVLASTTTVIPNTEAEIEGNGTQTKTTTERSFQMNLQFPITHGFMCLGVGNALMATISTVPHENLSLFAAAQRQKGNFSGDFGMSFANDFIHTTLRLGTTASIFDAAFGIDELKFGAKHSWGKSAIPSTTLFANYYRDFWSGQLTTRLQQRYIGLVVNRVIPSRQACVSACLKISEESRPAFGVGWKIQKNGFNIHSSVDTNGLVRSFMSTEMNENCVIGFSVSLDHSDRRYRCGLSMQFKE